MTWQPAAPAAFGAGRGTLPAAGPGPQPSPRQPRGTTAVIFPHRTESECWMFPRRLLAMETGGFAPLPATLLRAHADKQLSGRANPREAHAPRCAAPPRPRSRGRRVALATGRPGARSLTAKAAQDSRGSMQGWPNGAAHAGSSPTTTTTTAGRDGTETGLDPPL